MRAMRIHEFGGTASPRLEDLPEPSPGHGEVLVRLRAASLNYRDLLVVRGQYDPRIRLPMVPGSDGAGEVAAVGPGARRFKPGDRVMAAFMPGWVDGPPNPAGARSALGGGGVGTLAQAVVLPEAGLVAVPEHLSFEEAATLPCAAVTAWHALVVEGQVKPGDTVLVQGSGGVSVFALQLARLNGARVIATSGDDRKLERLLALGASDGINYRTTPDWDRAVLGLTGGLGVDHVVEVGGSGTLARSLHAVRMGGRVSMIGVLSGGAGEVSLFPVLMKNIRLQGVYVGSVAMFEALARAVALHRLRPVIDRVFDLEDTPAALRHMEAGAHFGKIVVRT